MNRLSLNILFVTVLALILSACNVPMLPPVSTAAPAVATLPAVATTEPDLSATPMPEMSPTPQAEPTRAPQSPSYRGFVIFDDDTKEFQGYNLEGSLLFHYAASAPHAPAPSDPQVVGDNIYFYSTLDKKLFRANEGGVMFLPDLPGEDLSGFKVSPDEQQIAYTITQWNANPVVSTLWIANLDGSGPKQVAQYNTDQTPAFYLVPLAWTESGELIFERSLTGMGGYILYAGHNSLYAYNPADGQTTTYIPAEELNGLCLDSYRLDLNTAVFNCSQQGSEIILRDLSDSSLKPAPAIDGYPIVGSALFSPSGQRLAYGAARGIPENEGGVVAVLPGDLSDSPAILTTIDGGFYKVLSWLDENTLLVARSEDPSPESTIMKLSLDGTQTDLAQGSFVGMLP